MGPSLNRGEENGRKEEVPEVRQPEDSFAHELAALCPCTSRACADSGFSQAPAGLSSARSHLAHQRAHVAPGRLGWVTAKAMEKRGG